MNTVEGSCHCGNISYQLIWPGAVAEIPVRKCGCTFCQKHGGAWTSHPQAELDIAIRDPNAVTQYQFGTRTADFFICTSCGGAPFVASDIDDHLFAVVNVNTFSNVDASALSSTSTDFDGETTGSRLERRKRNWIAAVRIRTAG